MNTGYTDDNCWTALEIARAHIIKPVGIEIFANSARSLFVIVNISIVPFGIEIESIEHQHLMF